MFRVSGRVADGPLGLGHPVCLEEAARRGWSAWPVVAELWERRLWGVEHGEWRWASVGLGPGAWGGCGQRAPTTGLWGLGHGPRATGGWGWA